MYRPNWITWLEPTWLTGRLGDLLNDVGLAVARASKNPPHRGSQRREQCGQHASRLARAARARIFQDARTKTKRDSVEVDLAKALSEVIHSGAPAQRELARLLVQSDLSDPEVRRTAITLIEAYRHDPYLTRNPGD